MIEDIEIIEVDMPKRKIGTKMWDFQIALGETIAEKYEKYKGKYVDLSEVSNPVGRYEEYDRLRREFVGND